MPRLHGIAERKFMFETDLDKISKYIVSGLLVYIGVIVAGIVTVLVGAIVYGLWVGGIQADLIFAVAVLIFITATRLVYKYGEKRSEERRVGKECRAR